MSANVSLYLQSRRIAQKVQMADFAVKLRDIDKLGHLCGDHAEIVRAEDEVEYVRIMSSTGRGKFACELCWVGLPRKVAS